MSGRSVEYRKDNGKLTHGNRKKKGGKIGKTVQAVKPTKSK